MAKVKKKRFLASDIGAELLPIMTRGLYRDPLDTLREYVQNSIDADATEVTIKISSDLVSIRDNGRGMKPDVADAAIRLGMSEKDPTEDVGFRGIGIYSAFNICETLEIFTRPSRGATSRILFEFSRIRDSLTEEEEARMRGEPSELHLEKLLSEAVSVEQVDTSPLQRKGTLVMMIGIRGEVYKRLIARTEVREYLESVVPVPFSPSFRYKRAIERKFHDEDYRTVDLELDIDSDVERCFKPYSNDMFTHGGDIAPKFIPIKDELGKGKLGFAWVCLNDARKYLPCRKELRGLLVRKFGFAVADRDYFARFFSRATFPKRITGEIIITHHGLLPNAARSDFEPSPLRDSLHLAFGKLATQITKWAEGIQNDFKATEVLETISPDVFQALQTIQESERDIAALLRLSNELVSYETKLSTHKRRLQKSAPKLLSRTVAALKEGQSQIAEILKARPQAKGKRGRIKRRRRAQAAAPSESELTHAKDKPANLSELLSAFDVDVSKEVGIFVDYLEQEVLQRKLGPQEYSNFLEELGEYLEKTL